MEIIRQVEIVRGKRKITFESGWQVWLLRGTTPAFPLEEGVAVDRDAFERFLLQRQYPPALEKAVSLLAERSRSRNEIEQRLRLCHYDAIVIAKVMERLDDERLLDDRDFSSQWVQSRMRKYGASRLYQELRRKGVEPDTARAAVEECSEEDQLETAVSIACKKLQSMRGETDRGKMFQRVSGTLVRRGYSWEIARKAFEEALNRAPEESGMR